MALWTLGAAMGVVALAGAGLSFAISRNGPAVLSAVDRMAGGARDTIVLARASTGPDEAQKLIVWGPDAREPGAPALPVIVFVHGGSWRSGDPEDYSFIARALVPEGFVVVLAGYRLHPDAVYPAMLEDTAAAAAWTLDNIAQHGGDPRRVTLMGHSAGAYNVAMVALEQRWLEERGRSADEIASVIGLSGPYDFYPFDSESTIASFGAASDPQATQPIAHIRSGAPPTLLIHGARDTLVRPRNSRILAERLNAVGVNALSVFPEEMEHNDPLIALAAPWRRNRTILDLVAGFALAANPRAARSAAPLAQTSVPVQPETR